MNDDWRLRADLHDEGFAHRLGEMLQARELEHDLERSYGDRVVVSVDGAEVFCYAGTRSQAEAAAQLIRRLASQHGWEIDADLRHWHPVAERWEPPDEPLPATASELAHEREDRFASERAESADRGYPEFEVRVRCGSRGEAAELSERLDGEGIANVHRWSYVLVGATDENAARSLSARLRDELPDHAVTVEHNPRGIWDDLPGNPFAVLGGLAG